MDTPAVELVAELEGEPEEPPVNVFAFVSYSDGSTTGAWLGGEPPGLVAGMEIVGTGAVPGTLLVSWDATTFTMDVAAVGSGADFWLFTTG